MQIITQNVDNLHERARSLNVIHLHGELTKARSTGPGEEVFELPGDNFEIKIGDKCPKGFQLRPHIVWFGEAVPEIERAIQITEKADVFLVIGTSMNVYPAAGLINYLTAGTPVFLIDPNEVAIHKQNVTSGRISKIHYFRAFSELWYCCHQNRCSCINWLRRHAR